MPDGGWRRALGWMLAAVLLVLSACAAEAATETRVALVVGNASYAHVAPLKNPANDAAAMAKALESLGFDVVPVINGDRLSMVRALGEFARRLKPDGVALFYYAGHGIQVKGANYLIPVDADVKTDYDAAFLSINVADVLRLMDEAGSRLNLVVLDACRDNPYQQQLRTSSAGLAPVDAPRASMIGYATAPGRTAADGESSNGLYTGALLKAMSVPGLKVEDVFKQAGGTVERASANRQTPWVHSSFRGDFYFIAPVGEASAGGGSAPASAALELAAWNSVASTTNPAVVEAFLRDFPNGRFARMAKARWDELSSKKVALQPAVPPGGGPLQELDATYVVLRTAKVRQEAAAAAKEIGTIGPDTVVWVTGRMRDKDWLRVAYNNGVGYVSSPLLQEVDAGEVAAWGKLKEARNPSEVEAFLQIFPSGFYSERASALLASLKPGAKPAATATPVVGLHWVPGTVFRDCAECPEMVMLAGGTAQIGVDDAEDEREGVPAGFRGRARPQHPVNIRPLAMGRYEVTVGEFTQFIAATGHASESGCSVFDGNKWVKDPLRNWREPGFAQTERDPVVCVSWDDARAYITWLSRKAGKTYRLPSEAEWEFAARGGTTTSRFWGDEINRACEFANVADRTAREKFDGWTVHDCQDGHVRTAAVGRFQPNPYGLHDMLGNVWEWTQDCWNANYTGAPPDSRPWEEYDCNRRVLRGGSWGDNPWSVRVGFRGRNNANYRSDTAGFRVARGE